MKASIVQRAVIAGWAFPRSPAAACQISRTSGTGLTWRILITISVEAGQEVDSKDATENRNEYFIMIPADRTDANTN